MSKQSDIFIQMEFKRKTYRNEINKALKDGTEKALNQEIRRVNKVLRDRFRKLEEKGLESLSPAYRALSNALGTANDKPVFLPPSAMAHDDKINYLRIIKEEIDNKTTTLGGTRDYFNKYRKEIPLLDKIYKKHGEKYAADVFGKMWEIKSKTDSFRYREVFDQHENEIIEILENFHDNGDVLEFNNEINELNRKIYDQPQKDFLSMVADYVK